MNYPKLKVIKASREMVDVFKGYNHNPRIGDGEFFDMKNMTSDNYPVLSPRGRRGVYASPEKPNGLIAKDSLCYVDGSKFVVNEYPVDMGLSDEPKQLISMGAYVIIMPDKKWINTLNTTEFGNIEAFWESTSDVTFSLCTMTGDAYEGATASATEPKDPVNKQYWIDTSSIPHTLKQYSATSAMWVSIATTYVKIAATNIGKSFGVYDGVSISGVTASGVDLNGDMIVWDRGDNYIVVTGILDKVTTQTTAEGKVKVQRAMPLMDYITEADNRLWGCRYGVASNGEVVNEIYACKLGDFKNWNCFMGLSTDSYAVGVGSDGPFTGAVTHLGYPMFFKETCFHKVYGNYPANFQVQDTACRGVQKGCHKSLAIVNETLFYKSRSGVMAYDGSLPTEVSYALGNEAYSDAVGGAHGNKYYISMKDSKDEYTLFVFDIAKGMWHKEDDLKVEDFCSCHGEMYAIGNGKINTMISSSGGSMWPVKWMVETGEIGMSSPDMKYISRINLRMSTDATSSFRIYAKYDFSDTWHHLYTAFNQKEMRSYSLPIRPKRCDNMKLRIEGEGNVKIYSITKTIEQGSDLS